jgi:Tfp pilus assembly protein PilV
LVNISNLAEVVQNNDLEWDVIKVQREGREMELRRLGVILCEEMVKG